MKHGVLAFSSLGGRGRELINIGDYIQGVAANQFMHAEVVLNRERLDSYDGDDVKVIMNGWFMHNPSRFPPSPRILPLFVAFHVSPRIAETLLTDEVVAYLRQHSPIGCRDVQTLKILKERGVDAYFSACLTLTLGRSYGQLTQKQRSGVCFVDPFLPFRRWDFLKGIPYGLAHMASVIRLYFLLKRDFLRGHGLFFRLKHFLLIGVYLRSYSKLFSHEVLMSAEYIGHDIDPNCYASDEDMFDRADRLLRRYACMRYCVTSRIHCALPCVGMGVPVIFVDSGKQAFSEGRFEGLRQFFNLATVTPEQVVAHFDFSSAERRGRIGLCEDIPVASKHDQYVRDLVARCMKFASEEEVMAR